MPFSSIGLYIHLPWCVQKCPYCDFNSHAIRQGLPEAKYVEAIRSDLCFEAEKLRNHEVTSIFFGGGTPSLFSGQAIRDLLEEAAQQLNLAKDVEITLEANPGTAEAENFRAYRDAGVNRLSLGLQSLDDDMLSRLGRIHTSEESLQAYEMARQAGFDNINVDLMYGLPGQDMNHGLDDLTAAIKLKPDHLSWYQLTLEPNTLFASQPPELPDHDTCHELQETGLVIIADAGYQRYEVSAYASQANQCKHNLNYWQFGDYLGIGAGAHSKLTGRQPVRYARFRHPDEYMQHAGSDRVYQREQPIQAGELLFEFLLNHLRLAQGFSLEHLQRCTGTSPAELASALQPAIDQGLVEIDSQNCRASNRGFRYLDEILVACLPVKLT
jgi:oxygen-independent coproporphyrinogen-3 oxidase